MQTLRIFVSSPGDVAEERDKARLVMADLQRRYDDQVVLLPVLWEDLAIPATASFQEGIDLILSERHRIDIAIFILWSRLGSPLGPAITKADGSPYRSGTEREFDVMLAAFEKSGGKSPLILAYTRNDNKGFNDRLEARNSDDDALEELIRQRRLVKQFINEHFRDEQGRNVRAHFNYREPVGFAQRLHVHLRAAVDDLLGAAIAPVPWTDAPYRSLDVFDVQHAPIFFGRDEETCEVLQRLRDQHAAGCAFVCIVGASGSGKSSLARAGAAATLLQRSFDAATAAWSAAIFIPGQAQGRLFSALAACLAASLPELAAGVGGLERVGGCLENRNGEAVDILLATAFERADARMKGSVRLLLVLDQMEELWTDRSISADGRERFLEAVELLARHDRLRVVASLRSDFYPQAQLSETFLRLKGERGHFDLRPPGPAALQVLITQPARRAGLTFERDERGGRTLDQQIFEDASRDPSSLPLLQYALRELFERRDRARRRLTYAAYAALGGVEGALGQRAGEVFDGLPAEARAALDEVLPLIVAVDVAGEMRAVRRRAPLAELETTPARRLLTERLTQARFLTTDAQDGVATVSLAHEALLRRWDRIADWVDANAAFLRMRAQVEQGQRRWAQASRAASLLVPDGLPLEEARRLLLEAPHLLAPDTAEYISLSIGDYLAQAIDSGRNLLRIAEDVKRKHPEVWRDVVARAFRAETPGHRCEAARLAVQAGAEFDRELERLVLDDPEESVRQAAAHALVARGEAASYDRLRDACQSRSSRSQTARAKHALARLLAVADMQSQRPAYATWFSAQEPALTRPALWLSRWLRFKLSLPVQLVVLLPAVALGVLGAASVKWLPSAFNYSCVQATPSIMLGLFHALPAGMILGGGVTLGLTLYRMVFGREYDSLSMWRPFPTIGFGAVSGLLAGLVCVVIVAFVYQPEALQQMGWIEESVRPPAGELFATLFLRNCCGLAFPLTSIGLGIALALMTNSLRASREWPEFVRQQSAISGASQVGRMLRGIVRVSWRHAAPIPVLVTVFAGIALFAMSVGGRSSALPDHSVAAVLLGGIDEPRPEGTRADPAAERAYVERQVQRRTRWKTSVEGRMLGLFGDGLAKVVGGYFCAVGIGLGIVILRHGVKIDPKRVS